MPEPTSLELLTPWLRRRVARLRSTTMSRSFPTSLEVVSPLHPAGADDVAHAGGECPFAGLDRALQVDLLCRLMAAVPSPAAVVVTRPGHHAARTVDDMGWLGPADTAGGVCGVELAAVVVLSRWGWLDLVSGRRRDWKRLRIRSS